MSKQAWSEQEINFILNNYKLMTWKEIAKQLNRTENSIQMKAKRLGIKKLPYYCNYDFFENIQTEEQAYWLGFITADGWISYGKNNSGELGIELAIKDIEHLKKFNKSINGNYNISIQENFCKFTNKKNISCKLRIYSIKLIKDLSKYNITPNKTYDIQLVNLEEKLMPHFIRGYFDGDGSIFVHHKTKKQIGVKFTSASENLIDELRKLLLNNGIKSYKNKIENINQYQTVPIFDLIIGGMKNIDNMLNYIYQDATIYLDRKLKRAILLYKDFKIEQRLPRHSEMSDFYFNWERKLES